VFNTEFKAPKSLSNKLKSAKRLMQSLGYDRENNGEADWTSASSWTWDYAKAMINCYWNATLFSLHDTIKDFIRRVNTQWTIEIGAQSFAAGSNAPAESEDTLSSPETVSFPQINNLNAEYCIDGLFWFKDRPMKWEVRKVAELRTLSQLLCRFHEQGKIVTLTQFVQRRDPNGVIKEMCTQHANGQPPPPPAQ
jgi:hypothetical protein